MLIEQTHMFEDLKLLGKKKNERVIPLNGTEKSKHTDSILSLEEKLWKARFGAF